LWLAATGLCSTYRGPDCYGKQDFVYLPTEDVYLYPAGESPLKARCTTGPERRITQWEHEHMLEAVQQCLDENPMAMRMRREAAEHPFATLKTRMGATHFLMKTLPCVATEMALHVLAYNLTGVMNILGIQPLMAAMRA
jgi:hypothetical protein